MRKSSPIEAAFTFPLDEQSAIYKFEAEVEGRLIVGECQGKEEVNILHNLGRYLHCSSTSQSFKLPFDNILSVEFI